jgi:FkbM family methyltransferase
MAPRKKSPAAPPAAEAEVAAPIETGTGTGAETGDDVGDAAQVEPITGVIRSHDLKFPLDRTVLRPRIRQSLRANGYERKETDAVLRVVKSSDTVIELGAGIGYMSTLMAVRCGATVHAFEGNPGLIPYIRSVHAANGATRATVHHALIAEQAGEVDFYVRKNILSSSMTPLEKEPHLSVAKVETRAARDVFAAIRPTVLVCDIEGAEAHVIPMLPLEGLRAAVVELHPQWIRQAGVKAVFDAFAAAGLTYFPQASEAKVVTFLRDW